MRRATASASAMRAASVSSARWKRPSRKSCRTAACGSQFGFHGAYLDEALHAIGDPPLPPYIASRRPADERDRSDYQTIYAAEEGAVAAPTAGLHFTPELFEKLDAAAISREFLTLHVGPGTFLPVKADEVSGHQMHAERGVLDAATAERLNRRESRGRPHRRGGDDGASSAGIRRRPGRQAPPVRRRHRHLHHAGLPVPRRRPADDQFPPAALDAVHAGCRLLRPRRR